ncbi:MAG: hypothetical protein LLF92_08645 [Planctomycetaceae bacterium]|nr:hypothetical protein [Planctomycetaceae bacterium]
MKVRILISVLLAVVLVAFAVSVSGCSEHVGKATVGTQRAESSILGGHGLGETEHERTDDHTRQLRLNGSMMIDDIDAWMMTDRTSRLTEFTVR